MSFDILWSSIVLIILGGILMQSNALVPLMATTNHKYTESLPATGRILLRPHENLGNLEDPGDELIRALNAEAHLDDDINDIGSSSRSNVLKQLEQDLEDEQDLVTKSALLIKMLEDPTLDILPVLYVEEDDDWNDLAVRESDSLINLNRINKRSRYYRRYPWKRYHKNRSTYDPELRYACTPSKEDVFRLLVNLHENRNGRNGKTISFCNRKRPARAIFTNIRFLG